MPKSAWGGAFPPSTGRTKGLSASSVSRHGIMLLGPRLGLGDGLIVAERHAVGAALRPCPMGIQVEAAPDGADDVGASAVRPVGHGGAVAVIVPGQRVVHDCSPSGLVCSAAWRCRSRKAHTRSRVCSRTWRRGIAASLFDGGRFDFGRAQPS